MPSKKCGINSLHWCVYTHVPWGVHRGGCCVIFKIGIYLVYFWGQEMSQNTEESVVLLTGGGGWCQAERGTELVRSRWLPLERCRAAGPQSSKEILFFLKRPLHSCD